MAEHGKAYRRGLILGAWLALAALPALGQPVDPGARGREVEAAEALLVTERLPEADAQWTIDHGGWWRGVGTSFDVATQPDRRVLRENDLRYWMRTQLFRGGYGYFRGQFAYSDFNKGDAPDDDEDSSFGPEFDRAYLALDVSSWFTDEQPRDVELRLGRQWFSVGSGLALSETYDGGQLVVQQGNIDFQAFAAYTVPTRDPDFDASRPGGDKTSRRVFSGALLRYNEFLLGDSPYMFIVLQRDRNRERPEDATQDFEYDSEYIGFGSDGSVFTPNLRYNLEYVYQSGRGFAANAPGQAANELQAHGGTAGIELLNDAPLKPTFFGRLAIGSGDPERQAINSTVNGHFNKDTTRSEVDRAFQYFGYADTGFASQFLVTNMQVISVGGALRPLEFIPLFETLEAGVIYYIYEKLREEGGISDVTASSTTETDVGTELDFYANWKLASDVTAGVLIGRFETGDVFPDAEIRDYLSANVTISF